ncbi:potassium transporter Kup [Rhodobacter capsulatus]|uniref:potassium transporter Kup n=1 Tax=Rhodobacter capsulatus TaxID=1061 RepID=UPI004029B906
MTALDTPPLSPADPRRAGLMAASLAVIGVVYGDIGTSPLYALREAMLATGAGAAGVERATVLGVLSLITWSLMLVVTLKYVLLLLRADNEGEGGTLSLLALAQRALGRPHRGILILGMIGAALFFGDAAITPAISVLSAIEGLTLVTERFQPMIVPMACAIIVVLFAVQSGGTERVARFFGPVTLVWFLVMAVGGIAALASDLSVLAALNPIHALRLVTSHGAIGFAVMGAAFLAVTGAEALYADMGHFGRRPIQLAWLVLVFPCLLLNYFGQGALLLSHPEAIENPFYLLYPDWALVPVVAMASMATVIASQAVISGAYSLTQQAVQLKLLPRLRLRQTSDVAQGQIYMPEVTFWLMVGVLFLVLTFRSSSGLASAYGIAVTGTMVVTASLAMVVMHRHWRWPVWLTALVMGPLLALDIVFLAANLTKILAGGYLPLGIGAGMLVLMVTWQRGSALVRTQERASNLPMETLLRQLRSDSIATVPGTAVYLTATPEEAPVALLHSLKHFKALHENIVLLTIVTADVPRVPAEAQVTMEEIDDRLRRVTMTFGYAEEPDVPKAFLQCRKLGWKPDIMATSFILSRRSLKLANRRRMPGWQSVLFFYLARNAASASDWFRIPASRVVEIGTQVNV